MLHGGPARLHAPPVPPRGCVQRGAAHLPFLPGAWRAEPGPPCAGLWPRLWTARRPEPALLQVSSMAGRRPDLSQGPLPCPAPSHAPSVARSSHPHPTCGGVSEGGSSLTKQSEQLGNTQSGVGKPRVLVAQPKAGGAGTVHTGAPVGRGHGEGSPHPSCRGHCLSLLPACLKALSSDPHF